MLTIRPAQPPSKSKDADAIWAILEPIIRAGEVFTTPRDMDREAALAYWFASHHEVFVAEAANELGAPQPALSLSKGLALETWDNRIVGTYFLCPNQPGGGAHVANCGYATAPHSQGR